MTDVLAIEEEAGRLLVESARVRAARLGPHDAHELRHLWAAINAGNSDPCGRNGESCHLDAETIRRWTSQYPTVVGYGFDPVAADPLYVEGPDLTDVATHATGWYLSVLVVVAAAFLVALYGWSRA